MKCDFSSHNFTAAAADSSRERAAICACVLYQSVHSAVVACAETMAVFETAYLRTTHTNSCSMQCVYTGSMRVLSMREVPGCSRMHTAFARNVEYSS